MYYQKQESDLVNSCVLFSHHSNEFSFNKHKSSKHSKNFNGRVQNDAWNDSPRKRTLQQVTDITGREKSKQMTQFKGSAYGPCIYLNLALDLLAIESSLTAGKAARRALDLSILLKLPGTF